MAHYDYIERRYGIRPKPGERVREADTGRDATVCKPHPGLGPIGLWVRVRFDEDPRYIVSIHPRDLIYLDRPWPESLYDPATGYALQPRKAAA